MASKELANRRRIEEHVPVSIDILDHDILVLIFEEVLIPLLPRLQTDRDQIWRTHERTSPLNVAHVSHRWKNLATPLQYRTMDFGVFIDNTPPKRDLATTQTFQTVLKNIKLHTRYALIDYRSIRGRERFDWKGLTDLIKSCKKLDCVKFLALDWASRYNKDQPTFPQCLTDTVRSLPNIRLSIEDFRFFDYSNEDKHFHTPSPVDLLPVSNLISYIGSHGTCPLAGFDDIDGSYLKVHSKVKKFFVTASKLEVLKIIDSSKTWCFKVEGGRLPPIKEFACKSYLWNHSPGDLSLIWDFSRLESLSLAYEVSRYCDLHGTLLGAFLRCVEPRLFPKLRKFRCINDHHHQNVHIEQLETERLMTRFVVALPELDELRIDGFGVKTVLDSICRIGDRLRVLKATIGRYMPSGPSHVQTLQVNVWDSWHLKKLQHCCPNIEELHISTLDVYRLVLTIEAQNIPYDQQCWNAAKIILMYTLSAKRGVKLSSFELIAGSYAQHRAIGDEDFRLSADFIFSWDGETFVKEEVVGSEASRMLRQARIDGKVAGG